MKPVTRDRLLLPILLPVGILVLIVAVLYGFSRILLSLPATAATATALVAASGIVVVSAIAASRRQVRLSTILAMLGATAGIAMLAGGIALAVAPEEEGGETELPVVTLAAFNIAFEPTSLVVPADEAFVLRFNNRDSGVQHNVDIFDNQDFSGTALFGGELVTGVREFDYQVDPLAPGGYFFRCIVHPNMTGEIEAVVGGGEGGGGGGGPTVVAQDIAFDTSTIELIADVPSTVTFDNRDAGVQHNIAIYTDNTMSDELFNGELVTGPATAEYQVPALDAGDYYFVCIVHPNMNGTVLVSAEGGGGAGPTGATEGGESTGTSGGEATGATGGEASGGAVSDPATVVAQNLAFDTAAIALPAGQDATLVFDNRDAGVQHNIVIATDSTLTDQLFSGELITGPATVDYQVPALEAGEYYFLCLVHPNMNGSVTVG